MESEKLRAITFLKVMKGEQFVDETAIPIDGIIYHMSCFYFSGQCDSDQLFHDNYAWYFLVFLLNHFYKPHDDANILPETYFIPGCHDLKGNFSLVGSSLPFSRIESKANM